MKLVVARLLIGALLIGGACAAMGADQPVGELASLTLTNETPTGVFPIAPETLASAPPVLVIRATRVVNPDKTAFHLLVYLAFRSGAERNEMEKILIGDLGFYPAQRPGGFLLRASNAFAQLKAAPSTATDVRLVLELRRIHEAKPWTKVNVTVAPPQWKTEPND